MEWTPETIRSFKDRHKLTAEKMAEMLGCNRSYVFLLMKGERKPSHIVCRLLECLDAKEVDNKPLAPCQTPEESEHDAAVIASVTVTPKIFGGAFEWSTMAISHLERIQSHDPDRMKALDEVEEFVRQQKEIVPKQKKRKST